MYFKHPPWDTGISPPELIEFIQHHPPGKAIDMGCGTGTNVITLAKNGWDTTGIDFVKKAIRKAELKAKQEQVSVTFYFNDVTNLSEINDTFDLVLDIGCFHTLSTMGKNRYITNLTRLLAPLGNFLVYGWLSDQDNRNSGITEGDILALSELLSLKNRLDSTEDGTTPSVWLTFERKPTMSNTLNVEN